MPAAQAGQGRREADGPPKADIILVIPLWRSLSAWPLLASDGAHLNKIVIGWMLFWPVLHKGKQVKSDTLSDRTQFLFLGLRLSGKTLVSQSWTS